MHISLDLSLLRHWHHKYFVLFYSLSHWCDSIVSLLIWYHHQLIKHAGTRYSFVEDKPQKASGQFGIHRRPQSKVFFYSIHRMSMCNQWMVSCIYINFSRLTLYILSWSRSTMHYPFLLCVAKRWDESPVTFTMESMGFFSRYTCVLYTTCLEYRLAYI